MKTDAIHISRAASAAGSAALDGASQPAAKPQPAAPDGRDAIAGSRPENDALRAFHERTQAGDAGAGAVAALAKGVNAAAAGPHRYELRSIPAVSPASGKANTSVAGIFDTAAGKPHAATGAARGAFAVRFDRPHTGPGGKPLGHHLNYGTLPNDPHVEVPAALVGAAGSSARVLEAAERVALPVAAGVDVARLGTAVAHDGGRIGAHTIATAGSVAGGWAGGFAGVEAGGAAGAAGGAALGAMFGVVGAVPGAAIGGVVGGLAGGIAGAMAGSWIGSDAAGTIASSR